MRPGSARRSCVIRDGREQQELLLWKAFCLDRETVVRNRDQNATVGQSITGNKSLNSNIWDGEHRCVLILDGDQPDKVHLQKFGVDRRGGLWGRRAWFCGLLRRRLYVAPATACEKGSEIFPGCHRGHFAGQRVDGRRTNCHDGFGRANGHRVGCCNGHAAGQSRDKPAPPTREKPVHHATRSCDRIRDSRRTHATAISGYAQA